MSCSGRLPRALPHLPLLMLLELLRLRCWLVKEWRLGLRSVFQKQERGEEIG
jgi:hypothetical protein